MTSYDDGLDRRLTARLDERAAPRAPDGLTEAITERIDATRQRPAWATTERWISMETRAQLGAVPRAVIVFATLALLTLVVATAIAIGASNPTRLPTPFGAAGNGLIAFVSDGDIHVVEPDGSGLTQITSGPETEYLPTWSRDGTRLAFWSGPEQGPTDLVVVDADGKNAVTVASTSGRPFSRIEWSADGAEIMYDAIVPELASDTFPCNGDDDAVACGSRLFVAAADGSVASRQVGDPNLNARHPVLSPDGNTVAFGGGGAAAGLALHLMEWDGSAVRALDAGIGGDQVWGFSGLSWSPGGDRIVTHTGMGQIWVVDLDDSGSFESAARLRPGYFPVYSPASAEINDGDGAIFADEQGDTADELAQFTGRWSPDATQLVRVANRSLEVFDRGTGEVTVIGTVDPTPGLTGYFTSEPERAYPSWQRVAQ